MSQTLVKPVRDPKSKQRPWYAKSYVITMQAQACKAFKHMLNGSREKHAKTREKKSKWPFFGSFFANISATLYSNSDHGVPKLHNFNAVTGVKLSNIRQLVPEISGKMFWIFLKSARLRPKNGHFRPDLADFSKLFFVLCNLSWTTVILVCLPGL